MNSMNSPKNTDLAWMLKSPTINSLGDFNTAANMNLISPNKKSAAIAEIPVDYCNPLTRPSNLP